MSILRAKPLKSVHPSVSPELEQSLTVKSSFFPTPAKKTKALHMVCMVAESFKKKFVTLSSIYQQVMKNLNLTRFPVITILKFIQFLTRKCTTNFILTIIILFVKLLKKPALTSLPRTVLKRIFLQEISKM